MSLTKSLRLAIQNCGFSHRHLRIRAGDDHAVCRMPSLLTDATLTGIFSNWLKTVEKRFDGRRHQINNFIRDLPRLSVDVDLT